MAKPKEKTTRVKVGDRFKINSYDKLAGFSGLEELPREEIVKVVSIDQKRRVLIGIVPVSGRRYSGWHNLDDSLEKPIGYYIELRHLTRNFISIPNKAIVNKEFSFRRRNLKNMECKVISPMPGNKESLVEFKEDVGGCGADGLGKAGRCLVIPNDILLIIGKQNKNKSKKSSWPK